MEAKTMAPETRTAATEVRPAQDRQIHLDALRSVLMILGVFLHASYIYALNEPWLVKDGDASRPLLWLNQAIHLFRIPCFFILSGFFAQLLLKKQGHAPFLRGRLRRLALPMISTAVLINTLQAWFLRSAEDPAAPGMAAFVGSWEYLRFWTGGEWVGHLWFLVNVIVYSLAAALLWALWKPIKPLAGRLAHFPPEALLRHGRFLALLPLANLAVLAGSSFFPFLYWKWGQLSVHEHLQFFPYFLFGLLLFLDRRLREEFQRVRIWQVAAFPVAFFLLRALTPHADSKAVEAITVYLEAFLVWSCCAFLFAAFRAVCRRQSRVIAYLSDASYTIYLLHHLCVVALGLWLTTVHWNVYLEFALVVAASLTATLAAHHFLVLRIPVVRLLFIGK